MSKKAKIKLERPNVDHLLWQNAEKVIAKKIALELAKIAKLKR